MNKDKFIRYVSSKLEQGIDVNLEYQIKGVSYKIKFLAADADINKGINGINIPSILAIPLSPNINNQLVVESNNLERDNLQEIIEQGIQTGIRSAQLTRDWLCPIVVPLIPSDKDYPYVENSGCYIRINDLYNLLLSKGLGENFISVVFGEYGLGPRYPKINLNEGVYFNYDAVMKFGNPSYTRIKK